MKLIFKLILGILGVLIIGAFGALIYGERWVNANLQDILNGNPDRRYDFELAKVDFRLLSKTIDVEGLAIFTRIEDSVTHVHGKVRKAALRNVHLRKLIFEKKLEIDGLIFSDPEFEVMLFSTTEKKEAPGDALQQFFGEILTRGAIKNFELDRGNAVFIEDGIRRGSLFNLGIKAFYLETDSLKVQNPIPFDYEQVMISFDSVNYLVNPEQEMKLGKMNFDSKREVFTLRDIRLSYLEGLYEAAKKQTYQKDLIQVRMDSLKIFGFGPGIRLHSQLDVRAKKMELFGLQLEDYRDKNLPRPENEVKPLFQGILAKVNVPLSIDSIKILNSRLSYGESVAGSADKWQIHFDEMNGYLINLTTLPDFQAVKKQFELHLTSKLESKGAMKTKIVVPYDRDEFHFDSELRNFSLDQLNQILQPIMSGRIAEGRLDRLHLKLDANASQSQVNFIFDYENLKVEMDNKSGNKVSKLKTGLANLLLNQTNMPGNSKYLTPAYRTLRIQSRGPFHLIWKSTKEGIMQVVPGGVAQELLLNK